MFNSPLIDFVMRLLLHRGGAVSRLATPVSELRSATNLVAVKKPVSCILRSSTGSL
jgi:hypothetical protein